MAGWIDRGETGAPHSSELCPMSRTVICSENLGPSGACFFALQVIPLSEFVVPGFAVLAWFPVLHDHISCLKEAFYGVMNWLETLGSLETVGLM